MGKRGRAKGIAGAAVRGAQKAIREEVRGKDQSARNLADATYGMAITWREEDGPIVLAPVNVTAAAFAPFIAQKIGMPTDPETLNRIAWYLTARFLDATEEVTEERVREKEAELSAADPE